MWNQVRDALNQSSARVLTGAATLLPNVFALLAAVFVAAVLGWAIGLIVRKALRGIDFDRHLTDWGWSELTGWYVESPSLLVARLVAWAVVVVGLFIGLAAFDPTLTSQLVLGLFGSAVNLVTAVAILVFGSLIARFLSRSVLISLVNMNLPSARLVSLGVKWLVTVMAAAMALDHLSIGGRIVDLAFGILFGGIVFALALAVGLRSKDFAEWTLKQPPEPPVTREREPFRHL